MRSRFRWGWWRSWVGRGLGWWWYRAVRVRGRLLRLRGFVGFGRIRGGVFFSFCVDRRSRSSASRCSYCTFRLFCGYSFSSFGCERGMVRDGVGSGFFKYLRF